MKTSMLVDQANTDNEDIHSIDQMNTDNEDIDAIDQVNTDNEDIHASRSSEHR